MTENVTDLQYDSQDEIGELKVRVKMNLFAELFVVEYKYSPTLGTWMMTRSELAHSDQDARQKFRDAVDRVKKLEAVS